MLLNCHKNVHYHNLGSFCSCFLSPCIERFHAVCAERPSSNRWVRQATSVSTCLFLTRFWQSRGKAWQNRNAAGLWLRYRVRKTENCTPHGSEADFFTGLSVAALRTSNYCTAHKHFAASSCLVTCLKWEPHNIASEMFPGLCWHI